MSQFVVIKRAVKVDAFGAANKMEDKNNIYDDSITSMISPFMDKNGRMITGLTKEEEAHYESKLELPKGKLNNQSDYWFGPEMRIRVEGTSSKIFIDDALGELKAKMLKAQPIVATSMRNYNPERHEYVMYEPEVEAEFELAKIDVELEAGEEFAKLTSSEIKELSTFYKLPTKGVADKVAKTNLYKEVKKQPKKFLTLRKDPYYQTKLFINNCVKEGVLKQNNKGYFWADDSTVPLSYSMEQFVEMLENKENQDLKIRLKQELTQATKKNNA